jgi:hypothetical protein
MFRKDTRTMLSRKELFKDTLKKAAHAWKRIVELRLTGPAPAQQHPTPSFLGHFFFYVYILFTDVRPCSFILD